MTSTEEAAESRISPKYNALRVSKRETAMSSAYGNIARPGDSAVDPLARLLPMSTTLPDSSTPVSVVRLTKDSPPAVLSTVMDMLNAEIEAGNSYPQETQLDLPGFLAYFLSHDAFAVLSNSEVAGAFYIKPNYPGRCSHICNGGFLTRNGFRRQGVATLMGTLFIKFAPLLGYRASVFNLVFENNEASVGTWRKLGFTEIGRVPNAGRLKKPEGGEEYVDAIMFYYDFVGTEEPEESDDR